MKEFVMRSDRLYVVFLICIVQVCHIKNVSHDYQCASFFFMDLATIRITVYENEINFIILRRAARCINDITEIQVLFLSSQSAITAKIIVYIIITIITGKWMMYPPHGGYMCCMNKNCVEKSVTYQTY